MRSRSANRRLICGVACLLGVGGLMAAGPASAHPMGNFSINHYCHLQAQARQLSLRYVLDMAEIPTVSERGAMDTDGDGKISATEREAYLRAMATRLRGGLMLMVDGRPALLESTGTDLAFRPGAGGLETLRITLDLAAPLPATPQGAWQIAYQDTNYAERTGWKEIVATAGTGMRLAESSVPTTDRSRELTAYPADASVLPPQQTEARFTLIKGSGPATLPAAGPLPPVKETPPNSGMAVSGPRTPQDAFTQAIAHRELTGGVILLSLGLAFLFGALHALSPGHGKAMVAAYLVGTRGTARHAVFLGAVVTLTHTIGVFLLGLVTLTATRFIVPERLYPILSALSGIAIVGIGIALLRQRWRERAEARFGEEFAGAPDAVDGEAAAYAIPTNAPLSLKSLLVLGITGGALPCPSALVVMLSAIALHRVVFGFLLIIAFSLGLATVLTGIGLLVVHARGWMERLPRNGHLVSRLPVVSAALVTVIGLVLVVKAVSGQF